MKVVHYRNFFFVAHKKRNQRGGFVSLCGSAITERNNTVRECTTLTHSDNKTANAIAENVPPLTQ
jgi:hypothetical protein